MYDAGMFSEKATDTGFEALSPEQLEEELAEQAAHVDAGVCRLLELAGEFRRRGDWQLGETSFAHWLSWRCSLAPAQAREYARVAERLPELPLIRAAFGRGGLSYAKVRVLARVADAGCEGELLELAGFLTASQLERAVGAYRRVTTGEARKGQERESLSYRWDEDGSLCLRARLPAEDGALLLRALERARAALRERRRQTDAEAAEEPPEREESGAEEEDAPEEHAARSFEPTPPELRVSNLDALVAMADIALTSPPAQRSGGDRSQVVVHVDAGALAADSGGRCQLEEGPAISAETARRLACDASLVHIVEADGETLSVGNKTRTVPPALRRALQARDECCRFPGCENRRFLDAHHLQHWADGGKTSLDNLILLCRKHHRLLHEGGCTLEYDPDGDVRFRNRHGVVIAPVPRPPPSNREALRDQNRTKGLTIDNRTCRNGTGDRMDLSLTVDALSSSIGSHRERG
jgi:hypothetical protein